MLTKNIIIILTIIVIILILLTLYLLYNENTNRMNIINSTNQIMLYNKKENFDYINSRYATAALPLPLPSPIFKFDPNDMSNITFTGGTPLMETDDQTNFNYVNFNNTFYGVSSSSITTADNKNITIECVFRYTGGTGVILANIGQRQINTGWHDSFIEVSEIDGVNYLLVGMWQMHGSAKPHINLGKVDVNTWYQVILWGSTQNVFSILNTISQSFISSGFVNIVPKNPQASNFQYFLGIGTTDATNLAGIGNQITGFVGEISYINVYKGIFYINSITKSKPVSIKISNVNYKIINPPEANRSYSTIFCGPECISNNKLYVCNYSMLDTKQGWSGAQNFPAENSAVVLGPVGMSPWLKCHMTPGDDPSWTANNATWNSSAKWIGGAPNFVTGVPATKYFFTKKITIVDPAKIYKAIFYIIADDNCDIYLNNVKINYLLVKHGWGTSNSSTAIIINNTNFIAGENTFLFEVNNTGGPAGLLAQLIITYYSGSGNTTDIYQTDSSWSYYGTVNPNFIDYIQLDLETPISVSGVVIQGRTDMQQIITSYNVSYLGDDDTWVYVNDNNGKTKKFTIDPSIYFTNVKHKYTNVFNNSIVTRYIKIIPLSSFGWISARVGVLTFVPEPTLFVETKLQYDEPTITMGEIPESNLLPIINDLNKNVETNLKAIINKYL